MADTLYQNYTTGHNAFLNVFGAFWKAQTFTPSISHNITRIVLRVYRVGDPGEITIAITNTTAGKPSGADLASGTAPTNAYTVEANGEWRTITLDTFPAVTASTQYAIVVKALGGDSANAIKWRLDSTSPTYSGGAKVFSTDSGSSWTIDTNQDFMFEEWGNATVPKFLAEGSSVGASNVMGTIIYNKAASLAGTSASASTASGDMTVSGQVLVVGSSASASSVTGLVETTRGIISSSTSASSVTGIVAVTTDIFIRGSSVAISTVSATLVVQLLADGGTIRMVPFIFSSSIAYMMELGLEYIRFFFDGEALLDGAAHVEVTTPYSEDDLYELQFDQIADTMWIVHPSHQQVKLTRTSATAFSLDEITFTKGPFLLRNDLDESKDTTITITPSDTEVDDAGTLTASSAIFESGHVGALFQVVHPRVNRETHGSKDPGTTGIIGEAIKTLGDFTWKITTTGWAGTVELEKSADDFVTTALVRQFTSGIRTFEGTELAEDMFYRINVTAHTTGTITSSLVVHTNSADGSKTGNNTGIIETAIPVKGDFNFNTHGTWDGTIVLERNVNEAGWEAFRTYTGKNDRNVQFAGTEEEDDVEFRINVTAHATGTIFADLTATDSTTKGVVRIDSVTSSTVVEMTVLSKIASATATKRWAEGAWSDVNGFPTAVAFHEGRVVYAGTLQSRTTLWFSKTDDYENFEEGTKDADSFSLTLTTTNNVEWAKSLDVLVIGTSGGEWVIRPDKLDTPLTPTNFDAKQQSSYGSKNRQAIVVNDVVLFVDFVGRKIREFTFRDDINKYVAPDLTSLAEHITSGIIVNMAYQRNPDSILWCVLDDGQLISLTYEREHNVVAWTRHPINGLVHSVAVIPGTTEDEVWLAIQRTIESEQRIYVELMASRTFSTQADAFFVDSGVPYNGVSTTTLTGFDHLEGESIAVLADGIDVGPLTVSSGTVTLTQPAVKAAGGKAFTSEAIPMRMDITTRQGTSHGSKKKIAEVTFDFLETLGTKYGKDSDNLFDINLSAEVPPVLFTGDVLEHLDAGFNTEDDFLISQDAPLPCILRAIIPKIEITGR